MTDRPTNLAVHRLLLRSLRDLEGIPDQDWAPYVQRMSRSLLLLDGDVARTLAAVVRAEMVIRQLLLDVLLSRPDAPPMPVIVAGAEGLLEGLRPELEESVPGPRARAVRAERDRS